MFFAKVYRRYHAELRADLQMYFGINLDHVINGEVSVFHCACLASNLPLGSATLAKIDKRLSFTNADWLLLAIANSWREKPIDPFKESKSTGIRTMSVEEMAEYLSRPREDVSASEF